MDMNYEKLAEQVLLMLAKTKAVGSTPTFQRGHGPGGTFSYPGVSPDVANAMVLPELGLQSMLPLRASQDAYPLHAIFTGVTNLTSGTKPVGVCDDGPTPGLSKLCMQTYTFGRLSMMTPVIDISRIGLINNRADFTDYRLIGGPTDDPFKASPTLPADYTAAMRNEIAKLMLEFRVSYARENSKLIYAGNPANNTSGGGYKEFRGLDILVNTGYIDAETGVACPAADSYVFNFASANISTDAPSATNIVNRLTAINRYLGALARQAGLSPVRWAVVMPEMLHYELTKVWPIAYFTVESTTVSAAQTNTNLNVGSVDLVTQRDAMRNGRYLMMDGKPVEVIYDDAIQRSNVSGVFTSPIYFIPLTVLGATPATYIEYFDWSAPGAALDMAKAVAIDGAFTVTDGGRFLWVKKPQTNFCVQSQVVESSRLRLDFPHLAARVQNVSYTPLVGTRSPYPSDPDFVDGGKTNRNDFAPSLWAPNQLVGAVG